MKHTKTFATLIALALILIGCGKHSHTLGESTSQRPEAYIFFSQSVDTKATLVETAGAMGQFGVVGFKYDNASFWEDYKVTSPLPTPNVFYDFNEASGEYNQVNFAKTVVCEDGEEGIYEPLQGWSNTKKYSFFAYYPIENDYLIPANADGSDYEGGIPYIKYTLDLDDRVNSMVDVMTASSDTSLFWHSAATGGNNLNDNSVRLTFKHRLSGLEVNIKNSSSGDVEIKSVTLTLGNLYKQAVIPLDGSQITLSGSVTEAANIVLSLSEADRTISPNGNYKGLSDKVIIIPQTVSVKAQIIFERKGHGSYATYEDRAEVTFLDENGVNPTLEEGKKYLLKLNVSESIVDVEGIFTYKDGEEVKNNEWDTQDPTTDSFN